MHFGGTVNQLKANPVVLLLCCGKKLDTKKEHINKCAPKQQPFCSKNFDEEHWYHTLNPSCSTKH